MVGLSDLKHSSKNRITPMNDLNTSSLMYRLGWNAFDNYASLRYVANLPHN